MSGLNFKIVSCFILVSLVTGLINHTRAQESKAMEQPSEPNDSLKNGISPEMKRFLEVITNENEKPQTEYSIEIDGLIVDETRTKAGHDFYDQFYNLWEAPPEASNFTVLIRETPFRVNITQIQVLVNDQEVVNTILQPRQELITNLAEEVVAALTEYLRTYQELSRQLDEGDQAGSGIF